MRASPVDLIGGYYKSDSLPWACQDTVNWLPVMAEVEGTRSLKMLETPPGLKPYQQIGTGPIRGMHDCEGLRLIVSGRYLYRITNAGVGVPLGVIPGVGRVSMTHNQFETGYQVLVENGQPGGGYVYSTVDQTFVRITDEGYPGSISSDYLDSFLLGVEPFGRFWFHSDLASATSYNTLDRYEAEASPDKIVGLAVSGQEVVVFGQRTTEFFMNVGAATGTFQNRNTGFDRGCASRDTIAKLDNSIFWLGDDGIVYRLNGYSAQPVSTRALDQQLSRYNLAQAFAFVWEDRGHKVYYLTFPDGQTFGYDVVTGLWHRRESFGLDRWRLTHVVEWSGKKYGGDFQTGRVFLIDWDYHLEGSDPIISERVSPVLSDNQSRLGIPSAELVFDTGQLDGQAAQAFPVQPTPPEIGGDLPVGKVGEAYAYTIPFSGGAAPLRLVVTSGSLPPGVSIDLQSGAISGVPTVGGGYKLTIRVVDKNDLYDEGDYQLAVVDELLIAGGQEFNADSSVYNVTFARNPVAGDLLLVFLGYGRYDNSGPPPVSVTAGWERISTSVDGYYAYHVYSKVAVGSDVLQVISANRISHAHSSVIIPAGHYETPAVNVAMREFSADEASYLIPPEPVTGWRYRYRIGVTLCSAGVSNTYAIRYPFEEGNQRWYEGVSNLTVNASICYDYSQTDEIEEYWEMGGAPIAQYPGRVYTVQVEI